MMGWACGSDRKTKSAHMISVGILSEICPLKIKRICEIALRWILRQQIVRIGDEHN
jgi:hypothetical protein